jgi:catechol 2,3-dioxygenase-like lactoylglutathione lyase family enzyme
MCTLGVTANAQDPSARDDATATQSSTLPDPYLGFFKLISTQPEQLETFYKDAFGFERVAMVDLPQFQELVLQLPDGTASLVLYHHKDDREVAVGNGHGPIGLITRDVDALHQAALAAGATELAAPMKFGPVRLSFLLDPEGHQIELIDSVVSGGASGNAPELVARWNERIESGAAFRDEDLMPDFLALEAISPDEMWGMWRGGRFDGGLTPNPINWYGKRFTSFEAVDPLMVRNAAGELVPFEGLGGARLREVWFMNKVSSTLIYKNQPIMDYFRKINDDTIVGWGEVADPTQSFFFWLKRDDQPRD